MPSSLNGTGVTFNDATTLQSGNIPAANMGSGTANSTTFLRGDRTWQAIPAPTSAQVLAATAGASVGAVGTYAFLSLASTKISTAGTTYAGSSLEYSGVMIVGSYSYGIAARVGFGVALAGTWRAMGRTDGTNVGAILRGSTLFLRIS
jgi:hypothetical protein